MPQRTIGKLRRVAWQLPLAITVLLVAVVVLVSWLAYREMRITALGTAEVRLQGASSQLADLLAQSGSQRLEEMGLLADDPALALALRRGSADSATVERLEAFRTSGAITAVELWDAQGTQLAVVQGLAPNAEVTTGTFPDWAESGAALSGFHAAEGLTWFQIAAPVPAPEGVAGYVVQSRVLASSPAERELITSLIGTSASFVVGAPGQGWTDLVELAPAPPWTGASGMSEHRGPDDAWWVGAGQAIDGTPWVVWVAFPREEVLAGATDFAVRLGGMGLVVGMLGGLGGLALSRRIAGPLGRLQQAAAAIATGDLSRRVKVDGPAELQELGAAFNVMAEKVETSQHYLEELVEKRTSELHASVEKFSALATSTHDAIITADESGRITYFNPGAERIFGYSSDEVVGLEVSVLVAEGLREAHQAGFAHYVKSREARIVGRTVELEGRRRNGEEFPVELSLASWERNGEPHFAGILRDTTVRKRAEVALQKYATDLEAANAELEAFSYSVSHDLRAPLRAIHGFSQALLEDQADRLEDAGADYLDRICAAADRMAALIDDLLELARVARKEMRHERVDLGALAHRIAADLLQGDPGREVDLRIDEGLSAHGDPALLRQVMQNLMENAWKFTSQSPSASIKVGRTTAPEGAFYVRDDGAGFDMQYADKLFGVFQRLHAVSEYSGTGVGLAIVQRIVNRHGGHIWAEAEPGRGATFYFTLPGAA